LSCPRPDASSFCNHLFLCPQAELLEIYESLATVVVTVRAVVESVKALQSLFAAQLQDRINRTSYMLCLVTGAFCGPQFLAAVYGMNVRTSSLPLLSVLCALRSPSAFMTRLLPTLIVSDDAVRRVPRAPLEIFLFSKGSMPLVVCVHVCGTSVCETHRWSICWHAVLLDRRPQYSGWHRDAFQADATAGLSGSLSNHRCRSKRYMHRAGTPLRVRSV
jgi:hypothetical protein